ncbi:MAG: tetratricopeptide TPR_3 [uncultured bacterium]|nr:MAG: tetratricopeptide TPR_3 [uncultured bacterium]KKT02638.1 MAG: hypothetical protein UV80_C0002G0105 [Candidatus Peregrinibacteria bacterium GW2011_GWF2_43_17]KKT18294.1 MAG: Tetratricopeptide [Candidatus Peregrinibacteria bacterium GW2011_GWA2_43_8]HAU39850.1 hypothetical protein [Candidatus Peregrinibacteria bacterium]
MADAAQQSGTNATQFVIPDEVANKFPDLVKLIKETESMTDAERNYWFQILPIMTEDQVVKLRGILMKEREQLAKLDNEYEKELKRINDKHAIEWKEFQTKKAREERKAQESVAAVEDQKAQEDILAKLNNA